MFLHFIVFNKQVSIEAENDMPLKEAILKAFEATETPIGGKYLVTAESIQNDQSTPADLGIVPNSVVRVIADNG